MALPVHGEKGVYSAGEWVPIEDWPKKLGPESGHACAECPAFDPLEKPSEFHFDVVVIGAGCVGACIARELSKYDIKVAVLEAADDVSNGGATKANSGIVHAGYDDRPGSLRAKYCWAGNQMFKQLDRELNFGYLINGSLVVARCEDDLKILDELMERGEKNGVKNLRVVGREELRRMEPGIAEEAIAALYSPDAGTVTPYEFAIALAENAACNGVAMRLCREVVGISKPEGNGDFVVEAKVTECVPRGSNARYAGIATAFFAAAVAVAVGSGWVSTPETPLSWSLPFVIAAGALVTGGFLAGQPSSRSTTTERYTARYVVNAAGMASDKVSAMAGAPDFEIHKRYGEYLLLHKDQGQFCRHVLFPAPGPLGKGIVIQPTLWGNLLLGPTARDESNPEHMARTTEDIIHELIVKCRELVGGFDCHKVIHSFAGVRAKSSRGDWIIEECPTVPRFIQAAGIDSPGLAGSPAIALEVVRLLRNAGLTTPPNPSFNPYRRPIVRPKNGWKGIKIGHEDPTCNVVCKCEKVTEAEIVDAIHRPLPCLSTQAVRKRTRAGMGHCQGEFCEPRVKEILARENRLPVSAVQGRPWPASSLLPRRWLTDEDKEMLCKIGGESKK